MPSLNMSTGNKEEQLGGFLCGQSCDDSGFSESWGDESCDRNAGIRK